MDKNAFYVKKINTTKKAKNLQISQSIPSSGEQIP